jgi:hypothetical protein
MEKLFHRFNREYTQYINSIMTIVRKDLEEIEPMSQERTEAIGQLPDEEIDLSDIPELDATFFKQAKQVRRIEEVSTTPVDKSFSA